MKTITKKNFLKLAMTFMAAFMFTAAMGQDPADFANAADEANISYVTINKTMPFYAVPDGFYHPSWDAFSDNLTAGFTWNWTSDAFGTELTLASQTDNYVEITANTLGDYPVNVKEQAPGAFGGCEDPDGTDVTIRVVAAPEIESFPYFTSIGLDDGETYQQCGPLNDISPSIEVTGFPNFQVRVSLVQQEIDGVGGDVNPANQILDQVEVVAGSGNSLTRGTETIVFDGPRDLTLIGGTQRTKYTYTIEGITDNVSRKSDYLSATTWYGGAQTFTIIVNPAPDTGPIFHIPNSYGEL